MAADPKTDPKKLSAEDPKPPTPPAIPAADAAASPAAGAPDPILEQGTPPENVPQVVAKTALAGKYRLVHGSVTFAPGKVAYPGALLSLSSEEAGPMLDVGVIEPAT